jgi:hypothetical protein
VQDDDTKVLQAQPVKIDLAPALLGLRGGRGKAASAPAPASAPPPKRRRLVLGIVAGIAVAACALAVAIHLGHGASPSGPGPEADARPQGASPSPASAPEAASPPPEEPSPAVRPKPAPLQTPAEPETPWARLRRVLREAETVEAERTTEQALELLAPHLPHPFPLCEGEPVKTQLAFARGCVTLNLAAIEERRGEIESALRLAEGLEHLRDAFPRLEAYVARLRKKREILKTYPPGPEWNAESKRKIMDKVLHGEAVSEAEREFYRRFDEWKRLTDPDACGIDAAVCGDGLPGILRRFPPGPEWNGRRKQRIIRRMLTAEGPTKEEREFYKHFGEWEKALAGLSRRSDSKPR